MLVSPPEQLARRFEECLGQNKKQKERNTAMPILVYKKGNPRDMSSQRQVSIFNKIITCRNARQLNENQSREQASFRKGYATTDHLQSASEGIEKISKEFY